MVEEAALVAGLVLLALAVLQAAAATGAPVGHLLWGGRHRVLPPRLRAGSAVSVVAYAAMAWVLLAGAALVPPGRTSLVTVLSWVLAGYVTLGVGVNAISPSRPERVVMTPTCALLAACAAVVASG